MFESSFPHGSGKTHVLVVDDGKDSCFLISEFLRTHGYEVFTLQNGSRWLQTLAKLSPDIILIDLKLHGIDCYSLLRQQQQHPQFQAIPTIVISACSEQIHRPQVIQLGACSYLLKPFLVEQLLHEIELHVDRKQGNRLLQQLPISA